MLVIRPKNITSGGVLVWILPKSDLIQHFGCKSFTERSPRKHYERVSAQLMQGVLSNGWLRSVFSGVSDQICGKHFRIVPMRDDLESRLTSLIV